MIRIQSLIIARVKRSLNFNFNFCTGETRLLNRGLIPEKSNQIPLRIEFRRGNSFAIPKTETLSWEEKSVPRSSVSGGVDVHFVSAVIKKRKGKGRGAEQTVIGCFRSPVRDTIIILHALVT